MKSMRLCDVLPFSGSEEPKIGPRSRNGPGAQKNFDWP